MIRNPGAEPEQRFRQFRCSHDAVNKSGFWMDFSHGAALLHVEGASSVVNGVDSSERACRGLKRISFSNLCILLGKFITIDGTLFRTAGAFYELQAGYAATFFEQFFVGKAAQPEVFPPWRLLFATMPFEHVGQEPPGVLVAGTLQWVLRHTAKEPLHQCKRTLPPLIDSFSGITCLDNRT